MNEDLVIDYEQTEGGDGDTFWSNVQWKGTDVCMDFHCPCGGLLHIDGITFGSFVCPGCATMWELGQPTVSLA